MTDEQKKPNDDEKTPAENLPDGSGTDTSPGNDDTDTVSGGEADD